jgi:hypothetical protein
MSPMIMKLNPIILFSVLLIFGLAPAIAQSADIIPICTASSESKKMIGDRYLLTLPKRAKVKTGMDIDYSSYSISYGKKKNRVWLSEMFGPLVLGQIVPKDLIESSVKVTPRIWKRGDVTVSDKKGQLKNGNYWRYFGETGELIRYEDVSAEAAEYFDSIIDTVCFRARR